MGMVLEQMDIKRVIRSRNTSKKHKVLLGQYLTPAPVASYMASLIDFSSFREISLLDPGAGLGVLGISAIEYIKKNDPTKKISLEVYEIDKTIIDELSKNLDTVSKINQVQYRIFEEDFIESSVFKIGWNVQKRYSHIIMNPPYKKLPSGSLQHKLLEDADINTVNYYSAFIWLALKMLQPQGQVIAIIPRSFCNGPYYRPFREYISKNFSLEHIHIFESRKQAFRDDAVLQENVIFVIRNSNETGNTKISWSSDSIMSDYCEILAPKESIINNKDKQLFFNIPINEDNKDCNNCFNLFSTIDSLGLSVSTGPIVDFRLKNELLDRINDAAVPLLYPIHFKDYRLKWPQISKKPNAIRRCEYVDKNVFPNGNYVVIRRFSSKEEKHRIIASLVSENDIKYSQYTFENHLNVIHNQKNGLNRYIALGLIVYLNSNYIDFEFRKFSGHTQVNSTDIRNMNFPTTDQLKSMGEILEKNGSWDNFDNILRDVLHE
jgi:adenine-specific DNA-methyltransferase